MASVLTKTKQLETPHAPNGEADGSTFESRHAETRRRMIEFMSDPDVQARYGHLLSGEGPEWEEDDSEDEVPDESHRQATRALREQYLARLK